jgi:manganese oxidase
MTEPVATTAWPRRRIIAHASPDTSNAGNHIMNAYRHYRMAPLVAAAITALSVSAPLPAHALMQQVVAEANPNLRAAGEYEAGALHVGLEMRLARWHPDGEDGTGLRVPVFAETGKAPQVPAPLLRMPAGTEVIVTLRNSLAVSASVYGLHARPAGEALPVRLEAGETRELRFNAGAAGTYHYYAIADPQVTKMTDGNSGRWYHDGALSGAYIVDDPTVAAVPDRVWVINIVSLRETPIMAEHEILTINGLAWPHTERLSARVGEPVHWRVVNSTPSEHPMHLHGAYFTVTGVGTSERFDRYESEDRRTVVTEHMPAEGTFDMTWTPRASGGWLFHCHYVLHMAAELAVPRVVPATAHNHAASPPPAAAASGVVHGMGGLVLAVDVEPADGTAPAAARGVARILDLIVEPGSNERGDIVTTLREVSSGRQTSSSPAPLLLLRQGEPVDIRVTNRLKEPTSIHWHGLELESYFDGVPGVGGTSSQVTPPILPGGTFVAQMTPPRAGTFIYHTHWAHETQLPRGLYGPLLVVDPDEEFDAEHHKVLLVSAGDLWWTTPEVLLNGSRTPDPIEFKLGETYRLRLINITPNQDITVSVGTAEVDLQWRAVAKDGFELPPSQRRLAPARLVFSVGETYDFEFTPQAAGTYRLRVRTNFSSDPAAEAVAAVQVRR